MQAVGWLIWGVGCLLLVKSVIRLRKPRGRVMRAVLCLFISGALALTALTPVSKFHLLWVLPLPVLVGLFGFGLLAGSAVVHQKLTARKPENKIPPEGSFPPFGRLTWNQYEYWEGETRLPAWGGFQSRRGPYGAEDSAAASDGSASVSVEPAEGDGPLEPTAAQCAALRHQIEHGDEVVRSVLTALVLYYRKVREDFGLDEVTMPEIAEPGGFRSRIGLNQVHVLPHASEGLAYVALEFGCEWDEEHGLGVVLHGSQVVEVGQASEAFEWQPDGSAAEAVGARNDFS